MKLTYNGNIRIETNPAIVDNLIRKGWIMNPERPRLPEINQLTQKVEYDEASNSYIISDLSAEQIAANEETRIKLEEHSKIEIARNKFSLLIEGGFTIQPENIVLALGESDRNAFSQMLGLVKEALELGLIDGDTLQTISDKNGQKHQLTTTRFRQVMVAYGFYFKTLWDGLNP